MSTVPHAMRGNPGSPIGAGNHLGELGNRAPLEPPWYMTELREKGTSSSTHTGRGHLLL
jgi:hypothetical protein